MTGRGGLCPCPSPSLGVGHLEFEGGRWHRGVHRNRDGTTWDRAPGLKAAATLVAILVLAVGYRAVTGGWPG